MDIIVSKVMNHNSHQPGNVTPEPVMRAPESFPGEKRVPDTARDINRTRLPMLLGSVPENWQTQGCYKVRGDFRIACHAPDSTY